MSTKQIYYRLGPLLGVLLIAARSGEPELLGFLEQTDRESMQGARHVAALVDALLGARHPPRSTEGCFGAAESHSRRSPGA